jgi:kexin
MEHHEVDSASDIVTEMQHTLDISDPMFPQQSHLINPQQPGNDLNIAGDWYR